MDIVTLFTREELVAGLSIGDAYARLVLLARDPINKKVFIKDLEEEALPAGVIERGVIKDEVKLSDALKKIRTRTSYKIRYVVVTIADTNSYSKIFSFPKTITGEKLDDAMRMSISFNLPVNTKDVYLDWESIESDEKNELFLATAPKDIINSYSRALAMAGLQAIAFETHLISSVRAIDIKEKGPTLLVDKRSTYTELAVVEDKNLLFTRSINKTLSDEELKDEVEKLSSFYESKGRPISKVLDIKNVHPPEKFKNEDKVKDNVGEWLPAIGASARGLLNRRDDRLVSLMSIGTELAYEKAKIKAFVKMLSELTTVFSVIISLSFVMVWVLMTIMQSNLQTEQVSAFPISGSAALMEDRVGLINAISSSLSDLLNKSPRWDTLITRIRENVTADVLISSLDANQNGNVSIMGVADTRADLNSLRNTLNNLSFISNVQVPLTNLDIRRDIPFSASFTVNLTELINSSTNEN